jgi:D-alanine-D-alanine ligase
LSKVYFVGEKQMTQRLKLALLYGGKSGEHEVSLVSAASVLQNLDKEKYEVIAIGIDKNGLIYQNRAEDLTQHTQSLPIKTPYSLAIHSLIDNATFCCDVDVVIPMIHGRDYEDGCLQGILRHAQVAFVGCDVIGSAIGMTKDIAKKLAVHGDIETAKFFLLEKNMSESVWKSIADQAVTELSWPIFVKPSNAGSSVGIHKAMDFDSLYSGILDAMTYDDEVLLEECITGREIEVAVLEDYKNAEIKASIPGEIKVKHKDGFYSYAAKYIESDCSEYLIPAPLSPEWTQKIRQAAIEIFKRLKCRGMARVDFFFDESNQKIYFNEVNTIPGFTSISFYPMLWSKTGLNIKNLLDCLIETAMLQHQTRRKLITDFCVK